MKRLLLPVLLGTACLFSAHVPAQDKKGENPLDKLPKPGAEHKLLATLAGTYDCKVKMWNPTGDTTDSTGLIVREMILEGRYLHEKITGAALGKEYNARAVIAFDLNKKKYVTASVDNFGTSINTTTGTYDPATKTFTFVGEFDMGDFGKGKTRDTLKIVSDTVQFMEMYKTPAQSGKEMKMMEITMTKKTK